MGQRRSNTHGFARLPIIPTLVTAFPVISGAAGVGILLAELSAGLGWALLVAGAALGATRRRMPWSKPRGRRVGKGEPGRVYRDGSVRSNATRLS
jgi:hypothetical protein